MRGAVVCGGGRDGCHDLKSGGGSSGRCPGRVLLCVFCPGHHFLLVLQWVMAELRSLILNKNPTPTAGSPSTKRFQVRLDNDKSSTKTKS